MKSRVIGPFTSYMTSGTWYLVPDKLNHMLVWRFVQNGQQRADGLLFPTRKEAIQWIKDNGFSIARIM